MLVLLLTLCIAINLRVLLLLLRAHTSSTLVSMLSSIENIRKVGMFNKLKLLTVLCAAGLLLGLLLWLTVAMALWLTAVALAAVLLAVL
jgi:hypothetical protein